MTHIKENNLNKLNIYNSLGHFGPKISNVNCKRTLGRAEFFIWICLSMLNQGINLKQVNSKCPSLPLDITEELSQGENLLQT